LTLRNPAGGHRVGDLDLSGVSVAGRKLRGGLDPRTRQQKDRAVQVVALRATGVYAPSAGHDSIPGPPESQSIGTVLVLMTRHYGTMPTTVALAVSLSDRFLEARASGEVQLDCFAGVATAGSLAPGEGIQQLCAPLSCLMMAIKFLEVRAPALSDVVWMANRLCLESQARSPPGSPRGNEEAEGDEAPRGQANLHLEEITTDDLREWEKFVWHALGYELNDVTSVDVLQGLVEREPSALAAVRDAAERKLKAAMCAPRLRQHSPIDLAVAALLLSADEGPDDHVTREQVEESLPSRLVSRPSLATTLSLLDQVLRHVYRHAQQ